MRNAGARPQVVIAGGGVAALEALLALRAEGGEDVQVTLVAPSDEFAFRAAELDEPFGRGRARRFALSALCADLGARFVRGSAVGVATDMKQVLLGSGEALEYDALLLAVGAMRFPAFTHGICFNARDEAEALEELLVDIDTHFVQRLAVVVPEGAGWTLPAYQLALSLAEYGRRPAGRELDVKLVTYEPGPVAAFGSVASRAVAEVLDESRIETVSRARAVVMDDRAVVAAEHWLTADRIVSIPVLAGPRLAGVEADSGGFIGVDGFCRVPKAPGVYAAGDGTAGRIKQGGLAAQQAETAVAYMLSVFGRGAAPDPYRPVLRGMLYTARGPLFLQSEPLDEVRTSMATRTPLWSPPSRVAAPRLTHHLDVGRFPAVA